MPSTTAKHNAATAICLLLAVIHQEVTVPPVHRKLVMQKHPAETPNTFFEKTCLLAIPVRIQTLFEAIPKASTICLATIDISLERKQVLYLHPNQPTSQQCITGTRLLQAVMHSRRTISPTSFSGHGVWGRDRNPI